MDFQSAYEKHLRFMQDVCAIDDIDERDLHIQFELLLSSLPNGGKLYKYRSLCGKSFAYAYDGLVNGYIWMPSAQWLNDDYDSVLIADAVEENKKFIDYVFRDLDKVLYSLFKNLGPQYWDDYSLLKGVPIDSVLTAFDPATGAMYDDRVLKLFGGYSDGEAKLQQLRELFKKLLDCWRTVLHQNTRELFMANEKARELYHVFSMSDSYDLGNMWGYYSDSGQGFCIEYDYTRAKELGPDAMRYLLNTYKVIYSDIPREIPIEILTEANFFGQFDQNAKEQITRSVFERVLSKDKSWEHEREWRIVLGNTGCKMPVDIVNAIIIDERSLGKNNAKKLIRLCKKRGWAVKVRRRHPYNTSHSYEDLFEGETDNE